MPSPTTLAPNATADVGQPLEELFLFVAGDTPGSVNFLLLEDGVNELETE